MLRSIGFPELIVLAVIILAVIGLVKVFGMFGTKSGNDEKRTPTSPTSVSTSSGNRFCTKCGASLNPDIVYCGTCGTRRS